ncbi:MAG: WG repeat-containing protein [Neisseriaceae bacterium]|nr:WG repeat-containing protein [Neisseriaceae bacterium]
MRCIFSVFVVMAMMFNQTAGAECVRPSLKGYQKVSCMSEGLVAVSKDMKWGFVDETGKVVVDLQYDFVADFKEGLAHAKKGRKKGYIDKTGAVLIPFEYDYVGNFENGEAKVNKGDDWFYIDKTGKKVRDVEKK